MKKSEILTATAYAGTYQFGGVEIVGTTNGIDDSLFYRCPVLGKPRAHRARVHYETDRPYILVYGRRLHLDEIEIYSLVRGQRLDAKCREEAVRHESK